MTISRINALAALEHRLHALQTLYAELSELYEGEELFNRKHCVSALIDLLEPKLFEGHSICKHCYEYLSDSQQVVSKELVQFLHSMDMYIDTFVK